MAPSLGIPGSPGISPAMPGSPGISPGIPVMPGKPKPSLGIPGSPPGTSPGNAGFAAAAEGSFGIGSTMPGGGG
eukprot:CAMPEP_0197622164 /NCGR_PEP_ID=MMETSP1338-20131121/2552_1 /TAXON_ID=43686 ORGANISM="Pelagodinium beii, Strain RCC1491" /NCGR_SAMPLE_ID=MMETSP1338 /ASSEMBLY_ACC=CAM_ASM_000754 /LENGTH=73 /DNA_ID=CAMNT_0043191833 /DNA_START=236 /DNA_END=457 /DNA_ORIENTATION=-